MLVRRLDELMARGLHQMGVILLTFLTGVDRQITKRHTFVEIQTRDAISTAVVCGTVRRGSRFVLCLHRLERRLLIRGEVCKAASA